MPHKRISPAALAALAITLLAGGAFAQRAADITVSKSSDNEGMVTTIQAAVNRATSGMVIEIQDTEIYNEQVTLDSTKHSITIRSRNPTSVVKPTIRWLDTVNVSPRNYAEGRREGYGVGQSGNFATCGAVRIIGAQGVILDGIAVDGIEARPFGYESVWPDVGGTSGRHPLFHANAAIALANSSGTVVRNCDIKNAYFGVSVKDRNTGGVFGNPNPADNDVTVPLSGFGKAGNHLIEHNRIHDNSLAFFFESAWDLGSSIRYNLIYENYHKPATKPRFATLPDAGNRAHGAMLFKDMILSPIAIYNNTFFKNYANFYADWQVGAPHLIFNNIFGPSIEKVGTQLDYVYAMGIDKKFPYRMNNCLFSAYAELKSDKRYINGCNRPQPVWPDTTPKGISGQEIFGITQVQIGNFPDPKAGVTTVGCIGELEGQTATTSEFIAHGGVLSDAVIPASANLRWLETSKSIEGTEDLFVSTEPTSPDFLRPKWNHPLVIDFIKNKGWAGSAAAAGIRNSDGGTADIGAIPSTGRAPASVVRIKPSNVVMVEGTTATANFYVTLESGVFEGAKISFLRWVAPLPYDEVVGGWGGNDAIPVPDRSIQAITPPTTALKVGNNEVKFTIPRALGPNDEYGFFELVIEGKDASGNTITSDVGFLPYRELDYKLEITVLKGTARVDTVTAGETYTLRVRPVLKNGNAFTQGDLNSVTYDLLSDAAAYMYEGTPPGGVALVEKPSLPRTGQDYTVYFTRAGEETIKGSGTYGTDANRLVFLGVKAITVLPGAPEKVVFVAPIPKRQLGDALPQVITGAGFDVQVEVQDMWGNATNQSVPVQIVSLATDIGSVSPATANTDRATGIASFTAKVEKGRAGQTFDLVATYATKNSSDTGSLRIGRTLDAIRVFYGDAGPDSNTVVDLDSIISKRFGEWALVTVKAVVGDTVMTNRTQWVLVSPGEGAPHDGLEFVADPTVPNAPRTNVFPLTSGIAKFYVGAKSGYPTEIKDAEITVRGLLTSSVNDTDRNIGAGQRRDINFEPIKTSVTGAEVHGDSAGRPTFLYVYYNTDGGDGLNGSIQPPERVTFKWPTTADDSVSVTGSAITVVDAATLRVSLPSASLPAGFTSVTSPQGLVLLHNPGGDIVGAFDLADKIGLVISDSSDRGKSSFGTSPSIVENVEPGVNPDTIRVTLSEQIDSIQRSNIRLYYSETGSGTGTALTVTAVGWAGGNTYWVEIAPSANGPVEGGWIKINAAGGLVDRAGNPVLDNNRWVRLILQEVAPSKVDAWYTSNSATGLMDYAYITFNKGVKIADWFTGGSFTINRAATPGGEAMMDYLSLTTDPNTLRIDLAKAYSASQREITTSGILDISVTFSPTQDDWGTMLVAANDRAKPVIATAVDFKIGGIGANNTEEPDTLIVTYSESMALGFDDKVATQKPVSIVQWRGSPAQRTDACQPTLRVVTAATTGTYTKFTYVVEGWEGCPEFPTSGDSVRINVTANVTDAPGNVQDEPANKLQPLKVVPAPTSWKVDVMNNPFRGGSGAVRIVIDPRAKGMRLETDATFIVFDNTGSVVTTHNEKFGVGVNGRTDNEVAWSWDGRNQKGRLAGTGTYLLKVVCNVDHYGENSTTKVKNEKKIVTRSVGLVRGKN